MNKNHDQHIIMMMTWMNYALMLIMCIGLLPKGIEGRQHWEFPKFNINLDPENNIHVDDSEKLGSIWHEQGITGLMALIGTRLQNQFSPNSPLKSQLRNCASKAENSLQYARCLAPLIRQKRLIDQWQKHRAYKKKLQIAKRELRRPRQAFRSVHDSDQSFNSSPSGQIMPNAMIPSQHGVSRLGRSEPITTTEKPILVEIADWLTDAVKTVKHKLPFHQQDATSSGQPGLDGRKFSAKFEDHFAKDTVIDESPVEKLVKRIFAPALFGNSTPPDEWSSKHLSTKAAFTNVTYALDNFLKTHVNNPNRPNANAIVPTWQIELLEDVHHMITQIMHDQPQQPNQHQPSMTAKILSPRLLALDSDDYDTKILSPDILSFTDQGIASIPSMLGATVGEQSRHAWLRFIMEASGANDYIDDKTMDKIMQSEHTGYDPASFSNIFDYTFDKFEDTFKNFYHTFTMQQIEAMEKKGYAYLSRDQIEYIYRSPESPCVEHNCSIQIDLDRYEKMTDAERDEALMDLILDMADQDTGKRRRKRNLILTPVIRSPLIRNPAAASMAVVLSPVILSPVILSPSIFGVIALSPALLSPAVLSPVLLGVRVLSPIVVSLAILSPLALYPFVLSPLVLDPFILCPYVFAPVILGPLVLSPGILDPNVLSPFILAPGVISPVILSPKALSPVILSPQVVGAVILSPRALSPVIASPTAVFALILSPNVFG